MTGFRDGQALESQALAHGKETLQGGNAGALSQGTLQVPSPCEEQLVEMAAAQTGTGSRGPYQVFQMSCSRLDTSKL